MPELVKDYYKNKGVAAVKRIAPSQIKIMTTTPSATSSTPSYIHDIAAQFQQNPLPDFTMLDAPDTFELSGTY